MYGDLGSWGVAATVIYVFSVVVPPVGMIIGSLLMIEPFFSVNNLNEQLKSETIYELPSWIDECSR